VYSSRIRLREGCPLTRLVIFLTAAALLLTACAAPAVAKPEGFDPGALAAGAMPRSAAPSTSGANPPSTGSTRAADDADLPADAALLLAIWRDSDEGGTLHQVDARTGADLPGHEPIFLGGNYWHALSPDGRTLAVISLPPGGISAEGRLRLIDLEAWSDRETGVRLHQWPTKLAFSPDGKRLALGASSPGDHRLILFDLSTHDVVAQASPDFAPLEIAFTPDGASLMVYGARYEGAEGLNSQPLAALVDTADLRVRWSEDLTGVMDGEYAVEGSNNQDLHLTSDWWRPAVVFAPESQHLYVVHADADMLTTVDFAQRSRRTVAIAPKLTWLERLLALGSFTAYAKELNGASKAAVLSADGERLYVVGRKMSTTQDARGNLTTNETVLGLKVIDVATGDEVAAADTPATGILWAGDGRHLFIGGWTNVGWTDVVDAETLEAEAHLPMIDLLTSCAFDGAPLTAASYSNSGAVTRIQVLSDASWEVVVNWTTRGYAEVWQAGRTGGP